MWYNKKKHNSLPPSAPCCMYKFTCVFSHVPLSNCRGAPVIPMVGRGSDCSCSDVVFSVKLPCLCWFDCLSFLLSLLAWMEITDDSGFERWLLLSSCLTLLKNHMMLRMLLFFLCQWMVINCLCLEAQCILYLKIFKHPLTGCCLYRTAICFGHCFCFNLCFFVTQIITLIWFVLVGYLLGSKPRELLGGLALPTKIGRTVANKHNIGRVMISCYLELC